MSREDVENFLDGLTTNRAVEFIVSDMFDKASSIVSEGYPSEAVMKKIVRNTIEAVKKEASYTL